MSLRKRFVLVVGAGILPLALAMATGAGGLVVVGLLLYMMLVGWIFYHIQRKLDHLTDLIREIEPEEIIESKPDEFELFAYSFSRIKDNFFHLYEIVRANSKKIKTTSKSIEKFTNLLTTGIKTQHESVERTAESIVELTRSAENFHQASQQLVEISQENALAMGEMSGSLNLIAQNAEYSKKLFEEVVDNALKSGQAAEKSVQGIEEIKAVMGSIANVIINLGSRLEKIGNTLEIITNIAEQTNLLALNAAIEAARAGKHGVGFAVVADEVRKLSENSTKATQQITELIHGIQEDARDAIETTKEGVEKVNMGIVYAKNAGDIAYGIIDVIRMVESYIVEITSAVIKQKTMAQQVFKSGEGINTFSEKIANGARENLEVVERIKGEIERIKKIIEQNQFGSKSLSKIAETLSREVEKLDAFELK